MNNSVKIFPWMIGLLFLVFGTGRISATDSSPTQMKTTLDLIVNNQLFAKGGLGIVTKNIFAVTDSMENQLLLEGGKRWIGGTNPQGIFIYKNEVISLENVPKDFDLQRCIMVMFQIERIYVMDFSTGAGGYYLRQRAKP